MIAQELFALVITLVYTNTRHTNQPVGIIVFFIQSSFLRLL